MTRTPTLLSTLVASGVFLSTAVAQAPPLPPARTRPAVETAPTPATAITKRGTIKAFDIGPNGETNGFVLRDGTVITLPPQSWTQLRAIAKEGSRVVVSGMIGPAGSGQVVINAQTITTNGQTLAVSAPAPPPADPNAPPPPPGARGNRGSAPPPPPDGAAPPPPPNAPPPPQRHLNS